MIELPNYEKMFRLLAATTSIFACLFFFASSGHASEQPSESITRIDSLFKYGEIDHAESEALKVLSSRNLEDEARIKLEILLGSIMVAKNDSVGAYQAFQRALRLRPDLILNNVTTSPKIMVVFEQAKKELKEDVVAPHTPEQLLFLEQTRLRMQGFPSGYLLPGWGMFRQERKQAGWLYSSFEIVLVAGALYETYSAEQARKDYNKATSLNATSRWKDYDSATHLRDDLWYGVIGIHAIGLLDLAIGKIPGPGKSTIGVVPGGVQVLFR